MSRSQTLLPLLTSHSCYFSLKIESTGLRYSSSGTIYLCAIELSVAAVQGRDLRWEPSDILLTDVIQGG